MTTLPLTGPEVAAITAFLYEAIGCLSTKPDAATTAAMIAAIPAKDKRHIGRHILQALTKLTKT